MSDVVLHAMILDLAMRVEKLEEQLSKKSTRFKPPLVTEVAEYIKEKNYDFEAETFVNFYEGKGWMIGKNKMKDWKAACRTWGVKKKTENNNSQPMEFRI